MSVEFLNKVRSLDGFCKSTLREILREKIQTLKSRDLDDQFIIGNHCLYIVLENVHSVICPQLCDNELHTHLTRQINSIAY